MITKYAKYVKGQKVKILSRGKDGRQEIEQYINEVGQVVASYWYSMSEFFHPTPDAKPEMQDYYCYTIRLDEAKNEIKGIPEDALELSSPF